MDKDTKKQFEKIDKQFGLINKQFQLISKRFDGMEKTMATKEDLKGFASKADLKGIESKMATKEDLKGFATKDDLMNAVAPLATKQDVRESTEELARIIAATVAEPMELNFLKIEDTSEVRKDVQKLKTDMLKIKQALHIT